MIQTAATVISTALALGVVVIAVGRDALARALRPMRDELEECRRDRSVLRQQVELVQRTLLGLLPASERGRLVQRIAEVELDDQPEAA